MPKPAPPAPRPVRFDENAGSPILARGSRRLKQPDPEPDPDSDPTECPLAAPTLLQPRVAAVLGVSKVWQKALFACRLLSIAPAVWWGLPNAVRVLALLRLLLDGSAAVGGGEGETNANAAEKLLFDRRLRLAETSLATIWCGASAYLSFFFTDCLMSRWLVNYTPQATVVRLLTISALIGYLTSWVLYLTGGSEDIHLLLPAWIGIATTLTVIYHITQRKINIRKETSMSISVFSMASYTSMVVLLAQLHSLHSARQPDYRPDVPLLALARHAYAEAGRIAIAVLEYGNWTRGEF